MSWNLPILRRLTGKREYLVIVAYRNHETGATKRSTYVGVLSEEEHEHLRAFLAQHFPTDLYTETFFFGTWTAFSNPSLERLEAEQLFKVLVDDWESIYQTVSSVRAPSSQPTESSPASPPPA